MIAFSSVSKQYGGQILFVDASFQINPGEKVGLVGPNGAGDDLDEVVARFGEVQARYQDLGGYELEARARTILHGLGFADDQMHNDVGTLSGG